MVDISCLKLYLFATVDDVDKRYIEQEIRNTSSEEVFESLLHLIDCTIWDKEHKYRLMQTTSYAYREHLTNLMYVISTYLNNDDIYFSKVITQHNTNLEYEINNPCVKYTDKKIKTKTPKTTVQKEQKVKSTEHKETAAERKIKAKIAKINSLSIPLKLKK